MSKGESYISRQAKRLSKGQIDRRRFVMSALATGVTMPTALSLASRAEAARPRPGGHLRYGVSEATFARLPALLSPLYDSRPDAPRHFTRRAEHARVGLGHFDRITLVPLADPRARHSAVMTGEVDAIDQVDPRALAMFASLPHLALAEHPGPRHMVLDVPDPELREALRFGLDRTSLLDRSLLGHGAIGHDVPLRDLPATAIAARFDPARARGHLTGEHPMPLTVDVTGIEGAPALLGLMNATSEAADLSFTPAPPGSRASIRLLEARADGDAHDAAHDPDRLIPLWCNDLVVHSTALTPDPQHRAPEDVALYWWSNGDS